MDKTPTSACCVKCQAVKTFKNSQTKEVVNCPVCKNVGCECHWQKCAPAPKESTKTNEISSKLVEPQSIEEIVALLKDYRPEGGESIKELFDGGDIYDWQRFEEIILPHIISKFPLYAKGEYERGKIDGLSPLEKTRNHPEYIKGRIEWAVEEFRAEAIKAIDENHEISEMMLVSRVKQILSALRTLDAGGGE